MLVVGSVLGSSVGMTGPRVGTCMDPHFPSVHFVSFGPELWASVTLAIPKIFPDSSALGIRLGRFDLVSCVVVIDLGDDEVFVMFFVSICDGFKGVVQIDGLNN